MIKSIGPIMVRGTPLENFNQMKTEIMIDFEQKTSTKDDITKIGFFWAI